VKMINPNVRKMMIDFVNHLERRGRSSGWRIISKASYDDKTNYTKSHSTRPPKTERKIMRMFWEWYEMGDDDLNYEIDTFLKTWGTE